MPSREEIAALLLPGLFVKADDIHVAITSAYVAADLFKQYPEYEAAHTAGAKFTKNFAVSEFSGALDGFNAYLAAKSAAVGLQVLRDTVGPVSIRDWDYDDDRVNGQVTVDITVDGVDSSVHYAVLP